MDEILERAVRAATETDHRPVRLTTLHEAQHIRSPYYRLLWQLALEVRPNLCVELGTNAGTGAAHLATVPGVVYAVDINPAAGRSVEKWCPSNVSFIRGDTLSAVSRFENDSIDILFVDANHTFNSAYSEVSQYWPKVKIDGWIICDDIHLDMAGKEMDVFWDLLPEPKWDLSQFHDTGFGVLRKKQASISPIAAVQPTAMARIEQNWRAGGH